MDVSDKSQAVVGGTLGRGRRRRNKETGLSGGASFFLIASPLQGQLHRLCESQHG